MDAAQPWEVLGRVLPKPLYVFLEDIRRRDVDLHTVWMDMYLAALMLDQRTAREQVRVVWIGDFHAQHLQGFLNSLPAASLHGVSWPENDYCQRIK